MSHHFEWSYFGACFSYCTCLHEITWFTKSSIDLVSANSPVLGFSHGVLEPTEQRSLSYRSN